MVFIDFMDEKESKTRGVKDTRLSNLYLHLTFFHFWDFIKDLVKPKNRKEDFHPKLEGEWSERNRERLSVARHKLFGLRKGPTENVPV